jgi:hypothetical protein
MSHSKLIAVLLDTIIMVLNVHSVTTTVPIAL